MGGTPVSTSGVELGDILAPLLPIGEYCGWNLGVSTTYTQVAPDPIINNGLPPSVGFPLVSFAGTESCFREKQDATVFYSSSNGGGQAGTAGLVGWDVTGGRVVSFSTLLGATELASTEYRRLFVNTVEWAAQVGPSSFQVTSLSPSKGGNAGTVTVTILGKDLQEGALVRLMEGSEVVLTGQNTVVASHRRIQTTFDLQGQGPRALTLVVVNPDGTSTVAPEAFTIEEGGAAQVWVGIVGRSLIRAGREQTYTLFYGNRGNGDAFDVILLVKIPAGLEFKVNIPPPNLPGVDWQRVPQGAIVGSEIVIPIWIYSVPFSSQSFSLSIQAPLEQSELKVRAEVLQSEPTQFTQTGDFAFAGASSVFFAATAAYSFLPIIDPEAPPVEDFAIGLHTWLQNNQEEIKLVPFCSLSVAAATGVLGRPITDPKALGILCDPFMPTVSSTPSPISSLSLTRFLDEPFYGNYCGPGWRDHNGNEKRDEDPIDLLLSLA